MTIETFSASTTWVCPAGVTDVSVECWGGGGGGGDITADNASIANAQVLTVSTFSITAGNS